MRSDKKNLLYFLTGRIDNYIGRTLEIGFNTTCAEVLASRFNANHEVLLEKDTLKSVDKLYNDLKAHIGDKSSKFSFLLDDITSLPKNGFREKLIVFYDGVSNKVDVDTLTKCINDLKCEYVVVIDEKDATVFSEFVKKITQDGFIEAAHGVIRKKPAKFAVCPERGYLEGYLFISKKGTKVDGYEKEEFEG